MPMVRTGMLALTLLLTLALSNARRDAAPPEVFAEVVERVPAAVPFELFLSSNEPVTYHVRYGELELQEVAQDLTVSLLALAGFRQLDVMAADAAGNETRLAFTIEGVAAPSPVLQVPAMVGAGEPLTARLSWPDTGAVLRETALELPWGSGDAVREAGSVTRVGVAPLGSADSLWAVEAKLVDEFGRVRESKEEIRVVAGTHPIEELNVSVTTLSVITPAGRDLEREAFERAYAAHSPEPLWTEPFLLPIEGRSTSGFGLPRRYAPGGPVSFHQGSDIGAPAGTPIRATNDGVVRVAGFFPIKGGLTIIDHGAGVSSLYFHQSRISVEEGERVTAGQPIGEVGSTGLSTGPHLHWEMRVAEVPSNPMAWVGKVWP